ncbi:MAG: hypothetical protein OQK04_00105 [Kangiellaceae bacterium]|nr:hypothetical protein [Kangiellaceae bacterium]MCW8997101.1 hypothetical protein [Kangiellaceae bacterium]
MIKKFDELTSIIEKSECYYIYDFKYDIIDSKLEMSLCENPDDYNVELNIVFLEIEKLSNNRFHDPSDRCLAEMSNYDFKEIDGKVSTRINTGDSVLEFLTRVEPLVKKVIRQ